MEKPKAMIQCQAILALRSGRLTVEEVCALYNIQPEDISHWQLLKKETRSPNLGLRNCEPKNLSSSLSQEVQSRILIEKTKASYSQQAPILRTRACAYTLSEECATFSPVLRLDTTP